MSAHRLHVNITERCNIRCAHCYWREYGEHSDPSVDTIDRILTQFKGLTHSYHERGRHVLTLGGGEPTLRPDLEEIIALGVRRGFRVRLVTNATLVDDARARSLKQAGLSVVQVSVDGATAATHDKVRGKGNWNRAMLGVSAFKRARLMTVLSYVLLPELNMEEAHRLLDVVRECGVAGAKYARPVMEGQAAINGLKMDADYWSAFLRILDYAQEIRYRRFLFFFDPLAHLLPQLQTRRTSGLLGLSTDLCQCNNTELVEVNGSTGDVTYCRIRTCLGNLWESNLADIWHTHPLLMSIRRKVAIGSCDSCTAWDACRGGCPAVVGSITKQPLLQDGACPTVQMQGKPLKFTTMGSAHPRQLSRLDQLSRAGRGLKQSVMNLVLK